MAVEAVRRWLARKVGWCLQMASTSRSIITVRGPRVICSVDLMDVLEFETLMVPVRQSSQEGLGMFASSTSTKMLQVYFGLTLLVCSHFFDNFSMVAALTDHFDMSLETFARFLGPAAA